MPHSEGWVKLYRSIQDWDVWDSDIPFCPRAAFIDLIMLVNHKNGNAHNRRKVSRGQRWTSITKLADRWHWRKAKVKDFLNELQMEKMLSVSYEAKGVMITVTNYNKYQNMNVGNEPQDQVTKGESAIKDI